MKGASGLALRPLAGAVRLGRGVERRARRAAADAVIATADAWLSSPEPARIVDAIANHEGTAKLVARIVESDAADQLVRHAIDSGLLDTALERLLLREQLWIVIDEIARSPAVAEAIAHQSRSAAGEVVEGVRDGSRRADAWVERLARRRKGNARDGNDARVRDDGPPAAEPASGGVPPVSDRPRNGNRPDAR